MEIANEVQDSSKRIASGFIVLPNGVCSTVAMGHDKKVVAGQDLPFRMHKAIQADLAQKDLLIQDQGRCMLNLGQVKIEGMQTQNQIAENQEIHAEHRQSK
ncbi:MAG: hypothetical protein J6B20_02215 [Clostridia bacterium]|nr:hypothetical protein [Clostridia bacterium]